MKKFRYENDSIHGLLLVDKPAGLTSHDVVDAIRRHFRLKKVGHTGTLDPVATGLLVLTIGKATKLTDKLISQSKDYVATCLLGKTSDTQDIEGKILSEAETAHLTENEIHQAVLKFSGEQYQEPPMFSAIKKNGKKLYELAREGIVIPRELKKINIFEIRVEEIQLPQVTFFVSCSKGTYVRTLCHDLGQKLGCGGLLNALKRTRSGLYHLEQASSFRELLGADINFLNTKILPLEKLESYAGI